jgi:hypothetical protein
MLSKKILEINRLFLRLSLDLIELKRSICKLKKLKVKKFSKTLENKKPNSNKDSQLQYWDIRKQSNIDRQLKPN